MNFKSTNWPPMPTVHLPKEKALLWGFHQMQWLRTGTLEFYFLDSEPPSPLLAL